MTKISALGTKFEWRSPIQEILSAGGISGILAIMITCGILYRYTIYGDTQFPDMLTHALSTIIGFYFGTGVTRATVRGALAKQHPSSN